MKFKENVVFDPTAAYTDSLLDEPTNNAFKVQNTTVHTGLQLISNCKLAVQSTLGPQRLAQLEYSM